MRSNYRLVDIPAGDSGTVTIELTGAASKLLGDLEWRDDVGPSWLVDATRCRHALVVTVLMGPWLERLRGVNADTVDQLHRLGLVELGPATAAPRYGYREPGDRHVGRTIALTELGRQRIRRVLPAVTA